MKKQTIKIEKVDGLKNHSFIDTGFKENGLKVYEGYLFYSDNDYKSFVGYFYKSKLKQLDNRKLSKKVERTIGTTFIAFTKSNKESWAQWFEGLESIKSKTA